MKCEVAYEAQAFIRDLIPKLLSSSYGNNTISFTQSLETKFYLKPHAEVTIVPFQYAKKILVPV
jgi:hypothetical protein